MKKKTFFKNCKNEFQFLEAKYNFKVITEKEEDWGYEIIYKNSTTAVKIIFEVRSFFVFIVLCKLQKGEIIKFSGEMRPNTILYCFDMDNLLLHKEPDALIPPHNLSTKLNEPLLKSIIRRQAKNLKDYADEILSGDFSIFTELDKIVKARAKKYAFDKWGERAHEFGW